jgi:hypothetical protein
LAAFLPVLDGKTLAAAARLGRTHGSSLLAGV